MSPQVLTLLTVTFTPEVVTKKVKVKTVHNSSNINNNNLIRKRSKIEKYQSWIFAVLLLILWLGVAYLAQTNLFRVKPDQIGRLTESEGIETLIIEESIQVMA
jgi:hypothetical protein